MTRKEWLQKFIELIDTDAPTLEYRRHFRIKAQHLPLYIKNTDAYREELACLIREEESSSDIKNQILNTASQEPTWTSPDKRKYWDGANWKIEEIKEEATDDWNLTQIPKIAHFYWGNPTLPYMRYISLASFVKLNPTWKVLLHRPSRYGSLMPSWSTSEHKSCDLSSIKDYSDSLKTLDIEQVLWDTDDLGGNISEIFKSDFLRWKLLGIQGGLWSDMDILYYKPMSELYLNSGPNCGQIETVYCYPKNISGFETHAVGFLMGCKNNKYFKKFSKMSEDCFDKTRYQSIGMNMLCDFSEETGELIKSTPEHHNLNPVAVYPYNWSNIHLFTRLREYGESVTNTNFMPATSIWIHWFGGDANSQVLISKLTSENVDEFPCHFSRIVKHLREKFPNELV